MALDVPRTPWREFLAGLDWRQGQHVSALGANGSGKSTLLLKLMEKRRYRLLMLTKPRDTTLSKWLESQKITKISKWPGPSRDYSLALWPPLRNRSDMDAQARIFSDAINGYTQARTRRKIEGAFQQGGWTILIDEVRVFMDLDLKRELTMLLTQGRSNDLTIVCGAQRPRYVPVEMLSEPTHLFLFHCSDRYDLERLADIGGRRVNDIRRIVPELNGHEFLYINKRTGALAVSEVVL